MSSHLPQIGDAQQNLHSSLTAFISSAFFSFVFRFRLKQSVSNRMFWYSINSDTFDSIYFADGPLFVTFFCLFFLRSFQPTFLKLNVRELVCDVWESDIELATTTTMFVWSKLMILEFFPFHFFTLTQRRAALHKSDNEKC